MKVRNNIALGGASKLIGVAALSAVLVACGGGGTSGDAADAGGTDGLGDTDGFGNTDVIGSSDGFGDLDGGVIPGEGDVADNIDTGDIDGGFVDPLDLDGNGIPDANALLPCQGLGGSDPVSGNADWADNCWLDFDIEPEDEDSVTESPFRISAYVQGVQRILFCREAAGTADSIDDFSDGIFGMDTRNAIRTFQEDEGLLADGRVGMQTWGRMQELVDDVALIVEADSDADFNAYGIQRVDEPTTSIDCEQQTNFFGRFATELEAEDLFEGWEYAKVAGTNIKGIFGTAPPTPVTADAN